MEVHHSHHHGQKRFKDYLSEFFMIFLAVTAGFFAETIRENISNKEREKEYIHSMISDLKTDTSKLASIDNNYRIFIKYQDSLMKNFKLLEGNFKVPLFLYLSSLSGYPDFIYTDGTIQQLKNAGGMRLIRKRPAMDSILAYDAAVKEALIDEEELDKKFYDVQNNRDQIINFRLLFDSTGNSKDPIKITQVLTRMQNEKVDILLTHDKVALNHFFNSIHSYSFLCSLVKSDMAHTNIKATRLIQYLQKEYDMK